MKEIIPFKKDIIFKTKISEVTDIALTHDYRIGHDTIDGAFNLNGEYKMTEASTIPEEFIFNIPFSISISDRFDKDTINLTIDDFNYSFDRDIMNIEVNMALVCEELPLTEEEEINDYIEEVVEERSDNNYTEINDYQADEIEETAIEINPDLDIEINPDLDIIDKVVNINEINSEINLDASTDNSINTITKNIINNEEYSTYKVYIVRKDDTVESICSKYNVSVEDIKNYNDLSEINVGDKIVIPFITNE